MARGPAVNAEGRHPGTQQLARWFTFDHLRDDLRPPSRACAELAQEMIDSLPDGPELTAGLRKLIEAKDCFVRAAIGTDAGAITEPRPRGMSFNEVRAEVGFKPTSQVIAEAGINPGQPPA